MEAKDIIKTSNIWRFSMLRCYSEQYLSWEFSVKVENFYRASKIYYYTRRFIFNFVKLLRYAYFLKLRFKLLVLSDFTVCEFYLLLFYHGYYYNRIFISVRLQLHNKSQRHISLISITRIGVRDLLQIPFIICYVLLENSFHKTR